MRFFVLLGIRNAIDVVRIKSIFTFFIAVDRDWGWLDIGHMVSLFNGEGEAGCFLGNIFQVEQNVAILYVRLRYLTIEFKLLGG